MRLTTGRRWQRARSNSLYGRYMSNTREELHQLVDAVDDDKVPDAATLLRGLTQRGARSSRELSFVGALDGGPDDLGEQHEAYLRERFDRLG